MVSKGRKSVSFEDIQKEVSDAALVSYYLGVSTIPCFIKSPLREDKKPSFGLHSQDGVRIYFTDFATGKKGGLYDLLSELWNCSYSEVLVRIHKDLIKVDKEAKVSITLPKGVSELTRRSGSQLECKTREWRDYDIEYWQSFGISLEWLKYAEVYPISHKIVITEGKRIVYGADKYAYAFVEHKEGRVTLKIYQPFNKVGKKWANKHDRSVISLWTKVPKTGDKIVTCSSLKDALCFWANTGIPAISLQGEGYGMSDSAISELKRRYKQVYILFDNDKAGLEDSKRLSETTGFINLVLPQFEGGKDVSDLMKSKGKDAFITIINSLFNQEVDENCPF